MEKQKYQFSVCTPSYNAAERLEKVYQALNGQSVQDFEWIVVDDGSKDGTKEVVADLAAKASFPIVYITQKHAGRPTAVNKGLKSARGDFFLILDSKSLPVPDALEKMLQHWNTIPVQERSYFISVAGLVAAQDGSIYGNTFPSSPFDSNSIETSTHYGVSGKKWGFMRTEVLQHYPYPVFKGEDFVPEELILNRIGTRAITRFVNDVFLELDREEVPSRLEELRLWIRNPKAAALFYNEFSEKRIPIVHRVKTCANYVRFSFHAGVVPDDAFKQAHKKLITFFMMWPGLFLYKRDLKKIAE